MNKPEGILLVDDDEVCNFLNENVIRLIDKDMKIESVLDGKSALDIVTKQPPGKKQLILLDLNLPVMDGFEFLDEFVKLQPNNRENIAIAILSSSNYDSDMQRARKYNVVCSYIIKPLTPEKVVSIIESCFQNGWKEE